MELRLLLLMRVLMLVACGPLLLPSGLCRCQPEVGLATSSQSPEPVAVKVCAHGHCHEVAPVEQPPQQPKKHKPGCPSELASVDRSPWTEPTVNVAAVPPLVSVIDTVAALPPVAHSSRHELPPYVPSTPLYLAHCALVI